MVYHLGGGIYLRWPRATESVIPGLLRVLLPTANFLFGGEKGLIFGLRLI